MGNFDGFPEDGKTSIPIPEVFFTDLLPVVEDLHELKVSLYALWSISGQVKDPRYIKIDDLLADERLLTCFGSTGAEQQENLIEALTKACGRGTLLEGRQGETVYYFLNNARGRAACAGLLHGAWLPEDEDRTPLRLQPERPNIYALYEQNIGPLTPILSETLQDAEKTYPVEWIDEAIRIAVVKNVRTWRYVEAILKSWKEKGRDGTDRKTDEENRKRDSEGRYADYVNR